MATPGRAPGLKRRGVERWLADSFQALLLNPAKAGPVAEAGGKLGDIIGRLRDDYREAESTAPKTAPGAVAVLSKSQCWS